MDELRSLTDGSCSKTLDRVFQGRKPELFADYRIPYGLFPRRALIKTFLSSHT